jgi:hypothetical protein
MLRRVVSVASILVLFLGIAFAEEIRAIITKVEGNKVTFMEAKGKEKGPEQTLSAADNVKVLKGKYNKDTKMYEDLQPLDQGLRNEKFSKIDAEKGMKALIITEGGKITEIRIGAGGKKKQ